MEEATKVSEEGANPSVEAEDPEAELTKSNTADPLKAVKDTTKLKHK